MWPETIRGQSECQSESQIAVVGDFRYHEWCVVVVVTTLCEGLPGVRAGAFFVYGHNPAAAVAIARCADAER